MADGFLASVSFVRSGDTVTFEMERRDGSFGEMYDCPRIPVIFSEYGYLKFWDFVTETAFGVTEFEFNGIDQEDNLIDEIRYDDKGDRYEFCFEGKTVLAIKTERFEFILDRDE